MSKITEKSKKSKETKKTKETKGGVLEHGIDQRGRTIERDLLVRAPRAEVYRLFSTAKGLESWFVSEASVGAKPGERYDLTFSAPDVDETVRVSGRIVQATEDERFAFLWHSGSKPSKTRPTIVTVEFADAPGGTRVTLVESGFGEGAAWDEHYQENCGGWAYMLNRIFALCEGVRERGRTISLSRRLAAAPAKVWDAVASGAGLSRWWLDDARVEARTGGAYFMRAGGHDIKGEVREARDGRAISYVWESSPCKAGMLPAPTLFTFLLAPDGAGTRVTLVHSGFGSGDQWDEIHDAHESGWSFYLSNLATTLDEGFDQRAGRSIERALTIAATPERVWRALVDPKELERWQCKRAACDAREGGAFRWEWQGGHADGFQGGLWGEGRVAAFEEKERLELVYRVPQFTEGKHSTLIAFDLASEKSGAACRLTLVHSGFDADPAWDGYYRGHREAWDVDLDELQSLCERGAPGRVLRCEVAFDGKPEAALDAMRAALPALAREGEGETASLVATGDPRARVRADRLGEETRIIVTEAHARAEVDEAAAYARWKLLLASVSRAPVQCGTMFA